MSTINNGLLDGTRRVEPEVRSLAVRGSLAGAPIGMRHRGAVAAGPPATGTWKGGDQVSDRAGVVWICTAGGSPGTWVGGLPQSQSIALPANDSWESIFAWTVTGQTDDPLPAAGVPTFQMVTTSRTYGSTPAIQGPVAYLGYNVLPPIGGPANAHGSATVNWFADAGDSNNGAGGHGIECNISFNGPGATVATGAFQMVAIDDTTNTVNTTIRCGNGTVNGATSNIIFENANASHVFCEMSGNNGNVTFLSAVNFTVDCTFECPLVTLTTSAAASTNAVFSVVATGTTSQAEIVLNGNNGGLANSTIFFQTSGTTQWQLEHLPPYLYLKDQVNNRSALTVYPGATAAAANFQVQSKLQSTSSLIVGTAAIATTATDGFLYLPSCAGAPTGTPTTQAGTVPCVFDTTDGKIYFYVGGAWVGLND
jgi:hypothetical protein